MAFVLHGLEEGDHFVDVGANVGSYTLLAAATGATVDAMEPVPETFEDLGINVRINDLTGQVALHRIAAGREETTVRFTATLDTTNHVVAKEEGEEDTIEVPVMPLDRILKGRVPTMLKIDVEGFETEVIAGAKGTLQDPNLLAVIMELNGSGRRYGYDETALHHQMLNSGFEPFRYDPFSRELTSDSDRSGNNGNCLYLRNLPEWRRRLKVGRIYRLGTGVVV